MKKGRATRSRFQIAVEATPDLAGAYRAGIQALEPADRERLGDRQTAGGSVNVDAALLKAQPSANRWDYGIGIGGATETVVWLEVHHASSGQADVVIKKLAWLKDWLQSRAPELARVNRRFVWLLSNVETNPNDRARRTRLAEKHGLIRVQGVLHLGKYAAGE